MLTCCVCVCDMHTGIARLISTHGIGSWGKLMKTLHATQCGPCMRNAATMPLCVRLRPTVSFSAQCPTNTQLGKSWRYPLPPQQQQQYNNASGSSGPHAAGTALVFCCPPLKHTHKHTQTTYLG